MNLLIFGSETGVMEYDFLKAISRINMVSFNYKPLSQGDVVDIYGSVFEVVWSPKQITEESLMIIEKALSEFYKALEEDKVYVTVGDGSFITVYLHELEVKIGEKTFKATIGFSKQLGIGFNIIGRKDIFERFKVCFNEKEKAVSL